MANKTINVKEGTKQRLEDAREQRQGPRNETLDELINRALDCLDKE